MLLININVNKYAIVLNINRFLTTITVQLSAVLLKDTPAIDSMLLRYSTAA